MAWIESHTVLGRHRKVIELAKEARFKPAHVVGHLHLLWHAALEQQENGDLSKWSDDMITDASGSPCDAPQWIRLLNKHGWLDNRLLHDWPDYAGAYLRGKYAKERRDVLVEIWAIHGRVYGESNKNPTAIQPKPISTLPNPTKPDHTQPKSKDAGVIIPEDLRPHEAEILDWLAYKRERQETYKPRGLAALWRALRAIHADKRRESIEYSMSNNWAGLFEKKGNGKSHGFVGPWEPTFQASPADQVIRVWREALAIPEDDRDSWNRANWESLQGPAAKLLAYMGTPEAAGDCIAHVFGKFSGKGLTLTLGTVLKHAHEFKNGGQG